MKTQQLREKIEPYLNAPTLVTVLTVTALLYGYNVNNIYKLFSPSEKDAIKKPIEATPAPTPKAPSKTERIKNPYARMTTAGTKKPVASSASSSPYATMAPKPKSTGQNTLGGTLNSITQNKIQDSAKSRRNLYFEHLRKNTLQLQHKQPTSDKNSPNGKAAQPLQTEPPTVTTNAQESEEALSQETLDAPTDEPIEDTEDNIELNDLIELEEALEELEQDTGS